MTKTHNSDQKIVNCASCIAHSTNLKPLGSDDYTPVQPPKQISSEPLKPLAEIKLGDDTNLLVTSDSGGALGILDTETGDTLWLGDYGGEILCALADKGRITAVSDAGVVDLKLIGRDDDAQWCDMDSRRWPPISMYAIQGVQATSVVPRRQLSVDYSKDGHQLRDTDRRAITDDLRRAYTDLVRQSRAQGAFCAPAMMHYRFIGHNGETLYDSPPLLLGPSDTSMLTAPMTVTSSDHRNLDPHVVAAPTWRLSLVGYGNIPKEMADAVSRVEILASPQFHPFDPSGDADIQLVWQSADETMMRVTMPGASRAVASGNAKLGEARLRQMVAVLPAVERVVAVVNGPFKEGEQFFAMPELQFSFGDVAAECKSVEKAMALVPEIVDQTLRDLSWPHSISGTTIAAVADYIILGNLIAWKFGGYPIQSFAGMPRGDGPWHGFISIQFASGKERLVSVEQGESGLPRFFNPVIGYPSPDAVSMTITIESAGKVLSKTLPLTPDPSGRWALYVNDSFAPFQLDEELDAFVVPPESKIARPYVGHLALAHSDAPAMPVAVASVGKATIHSIFAATRSQSSWDYSKIRFSVITSEGVYIVTITPGKVPRISVNLIDSRASPGPNAAVNASGRVLAILDDTLTEIGITRCKDILPLPNKLLIANSSLLITNSTLLIANCVIDLNDLSSYIRDETVTGRAVGSYAVVNGRLCDFSREEPVASVYVRLDGYHDFGDSYVRPRGLIFDIRSPMIAYGELSVSRMSHNDIEPSPSLRLTLNGPVGSPLVIPFPALPMRALKFTFQGRLHPSTILRSPKISVSSDSV